MLKNYTFILPYLFQLLLNIVIVFIIVLIFRIYRKIRVDRNRPFFSLSEWMGSFDSKNAFVSLAITLALANTASVSLTNIVENLDELRALVKELNATSNQLALQGRTAISNFPEFKKKATFMLKEVDNVDQAEVKVALFWPMFGADFGEEFLDFINNRNTKPPSFNDKSENDFYHYLFRRIDHDMPTRLLLLDYRQDGSGSSELQRFMCALGSYEIEGANGKKFTLFNEEIVPSLEEEVVKHIKDKIIPQVKAADNVTLRVTENLPVLLFIVERIDKNLPDEQKALLFIGNVDMLESQAKQGGFYTEDKKMVKILSDFYDALSKKAKSIDVKDAKT